MFIRKKCKKDKKTNKTYSVYQLVESVRTEKGPRQRILLHLGVNLELSDGDLKDLANRIEELTTGNVSFIDYPKHIEQLAQTFSKQLIRKNLENNNINNKNVEDNKTGKENTDNNKEFQSVDVNSTVLEKTRTVGMEYICYETAKTLKIDEKLKDFGLTPRQVEVALGVIIGRLLFPASEQATYNWLHNQSGLDEIIKTDFTKLSLDTVYKAGDLLLNHKDELENHLYKTEKDLFSFDNVIIFYDLTNTFFEGSGASIKLTERGHSKEKRSDCPLVTLGLVINQFGFPLQSKILPGNISEPKTLQDCIEKLRVDKSTQPIIIMDGGIATKENLEYLRKSGFRYIVSSRSRSCSIPQDLDFQIVKQKGNNVVKATKLSKNEVGEIDLFCHSTSCEQKEKSMFLLLQKRFEEDIQSIKDSLKKQRGIKKISKVFQRIGRLKQKHSKIASYYDIDVKVDEIKDSVIDITWKEKKKKIENRFQGAHILKTYGLDWKEEELWNTYTTLTEVERSFRYLKSDLGFRPVFHKIDRRVKAHLFICVIAYHIMQTILYKLKKKGIPLSFKTLKNNMSSQTVSSVSIKLEDNRLLRIRAITAPEDFHKNIYSALNLSSPTKFQKAIF